MQSGIKMQLMKCQLMSCVYICVSSNTLVHTQISNYTTAVSKLMITHSEICITGDKISRNTDRCW